MGATTIETSDIGAKVSPGFQRGEAEHGLEEDGQGQEEAEHAKRHDRRKRVADGEVSILEEREGDERLLLPSLPGDEEREQDRAGNEQRGNADQAPVRAQGIEGERVAEGSPVISLSLDEGEDQRGEAGAGEQNPDRIEVVRPAELDRGQQPDAEPEGGNPHRDVDPEDGAPVVVGDEEAAQRRTGDRGHTGDRAPDPERRSPPFRGEDVRDHAQGLRREDRPTDALHDPGGDQLARALGQATGDRGQREDRQPDQEEPPGAEHVAQATGSDQQDGVGEDVRIQDPEDAVEAGVQAVDDAGNPDVHDREVQQDHEKAEAEDEQDDPRAVLRDVRRLRRHPGSLGKAHHRVPSRTQLVSRRLR